MSLKKYFLFKITGVVQGVGFRPFIYREAKKKGVCGYVKNTGDGVEIVCDDRNKIKEILKKIPPLASILSIKIEKTCTTIRTFNDFKIEFSEKNTKNKNAKIPADTTICDDCVSEVLDENNRRHKYFFISCTNCGPRYSISKDIPFDRKNTSLNKFPLCKECEKEYTNPADRRFHAQTIACSKCGPKLEFYEKGKKLKTDPLNHSIDLIKKGEVVSVKGIGGFSLFCKADKKTTLKLRELLHRPYKPFAIMVRDLEMAKKIVNISDKEREILSSNKRPIVLCKKKYFCHSEFNSESKKTVILNLFQDLSFLSSNNRIGVMLPYTALHYLFFEEIDQPLIITSANMPGLPIPTKREEQNWQYVLDYNREITNFSDDSIVKVIDNYPLIIRRSRGYVPNEISIPSNYQNFDGDILSVGGEMKNTFCVKKDNNLILSSHLGDTEKLENFNNFKTTLKKFLHTTNTKPNIILCDDNPSFNTSKFAQEYAKEKNIKCIKVQHHISHTFSVALEHNLTDFIGIAVDGTGIGDDGEVWGGEVFSINNKQLTLNNNSCKPKNQNIQRIGHLEYQKLVGGDIANKEPVRFLVGILEKFMRIEEIQKILSNFESKNLNIFYQQAKQNFNCIETSSCGRILDAACILLGFGEKNHYEGYLAEMLESNSICHPEFEVNCAMRTREYPLGDISESPEPIIEKQNDQYILKTTELFQFLIKNLNKIPKEKLATFVQLYLAKGLYQLAINNKQLTINKKLPIVLSGGCTYNEIMTTYLLSKGVKLNKEIPAGDGGISVGQVGYCLWKKTR